MNRSTFVKAWLFRARLRSYNARPTSSKYRSFSNLSNRLDQPILKAVEDRNYELVAEYGKRMDPKNGLSPSVLNAAMSAQRMVGSNFNFRPAEDDDAQLNATDSLYMTLQRSCVDNSIDAVEAILLRLLDKYQLYSSSQDVTLMGLRRLLGNDSQLISKKQRRLALSEVSRTLSSSQMQNWISIKPNGSLDGLRQTLNDLELEHSNARDHKHRKQAAVDVAAEHLRRCRAAKKPVKTDQVLVSRLVASEMLPSKEDVEEQTEELQFLGEELSEYESALEEAEKRFAQAKEKLSTASEALFQKETAFQAVQSKYAAATSDVITTGTTPLYVWATFLRFYAARNAWRECVTLLEIAEVQHPLSSDDSAASTDSSAKTHFMSMYHDVLQALSHAGQFEQVLSTLTQMRTLSLPVEVTAVVSLLTAFSTVTPSSTFTVNAANYPLLGKLLVSLKDEVVRCVVQVGDSQGELNLNEGKELSDKKYSSLVSTRGYLTTLNLVEMYLKQLVSLNQFQVAEQMVSFLHEVYPQFLTSKGLLPLLTVYKQQGRYDEVVKFYNLWSKSVFKRHQENTLYHVVFDAVRLKDGANVNRGVKFLDSNNPKVE